MKLLAYPAPGFFQAESQVSGTSQELAFQAHASLPFSWRQTPDFSPLQSLLSVGSIVAAEPCPGELPAAAAPPLWLGLGRCTYQALEVQHETRNGCHEPRGQSRPPHRGPRRHPWCRQRCHLIARGNDGTKKSQISLIWPVPGNLWCSPGKISVFYSANYGIP